MLFNKLFHPNPQFLFFVHLNHTTLCSIGFAETAKPPNTSDRVKALAELLRHFELARGHEDEQTDDGFLEALEQKAGEQAWEE